MPNWLSVIGLNQTDLEIKDATARAQILSMAINAADYGVDTTGTTDSSDAMQAALDAANAAGVPLQIPSGTIKIATTLRYYSNQLITGSGNTTLLWSGSSGATDSYLFFPQITGVAEYGGVHDTTFSNLTIDGGGITVTGIATCHAANIKIIGCTFTHFGGYHGVELNSTRDAKIIACTFTNFSKIDGEGEMIQIDAAYQAGIPGGEPYDNTACRGIIIQGCYFSNLGIWTAGQLYGCAGIGSHTIINAPSWNIVISGCVFYQLWAGVKFRQGIGIYVTGCSFQDCQNGVVANYGTTDITTIHVRYLTVVGCNFAGPGSGATSGVAIDLLPISDPGNVGAGSDHCMLTNNVIVNGWVGIRQYGYYNMIANNVFTGFTDASYCISRVSNNFLGSYNYFGQTKLDDGTP